MKTYYLLSKDNSKYVIKKVNTLTIDDAIKIFSKLKKLSKEDPLTVFIVTDKV